MSKQSAGILAYRIKGNKLEVLLVHPGGPFYKNKDEGVWSIPKGEFGDDEKALDAAKREFKEETGQSIKGEFIELTPIKYKSGKVVYAWAVETEIDLNAFSSNTFSLEWPPKSGKYIEVPEMDKAEWFEIIKAEQKILPALAPLLHQLKKITPH